jgi:LemA protein
MKTKNKSLIIVIAVILILVFWTAGKYNGMVKTSEDVKTNQSNIETNLQRRADLIPNLVSTVKGYAAHESEVIDSIADARSKMAGAKTTEEALKADGELTQALSKLLVVVEQYPDLKANENFKMLQTELEGTENRIAIARRDYNESAKKYNTQIKRFPTNIFAKMFGFEQVPYFEAAPGSEKAPEVKF